MRHVWKRTVLAALATAFIAPALWAQETTGNITGTVRDGTGAVLPGVTVTVRNTATGFTRDYVTGGEGVYNATLLPVGPYELTYALSGFQTASLKNVALHVNDRLNLDVALAAGGLTETVEVSASTQIQATPAVQNLMGPTQLQELPLNNRNFVQLATLVPGVTSSLSDEVGVGLASTVSISINGARRNGVNWLVDGASNVDVGSNITLLSTPTLESVEEFKIITSSYAAEWPRSGGGVINVVTKSGTNEFRAVVYEFTRNDALNANSFFRKQAGCQADGTCSQDPNSVALRSEPARLRYHNYGFTFGGPLQRDKLFFFYSQEWRNISRAPASVTANVVDPAWLSDPANANYVAPAQRDPNAVALLSAFPAPNLGSNRFISSRPNDQDTRQEVLRLDYNLNSKWRLMGRFTHDLSRTTEPGGLFTNTPLPDIATTETDVPGRVGVLNVTTTLSPVTLNEFSFQYSANDISSTNPDGTRIQRSDYPGLNVPEIYAGNPGNVFPTVNISGLSLATASQLFDIEYRNYTIADNLSLQRGSHSIKLGGLAAFEAKNENASSNTQGRFDFAAGGGFTAFQNFMRGNADGACGASCSYTEAQNDVVAHLRFPRYELYVQDSWKVKPNLTFDAGLRYSLYMPMEDTEDALTNFVPARFVRANAPRFTSPAATAIDVTTGDLLNGIVVAGSTSPHGRSIYDLDKNNFGPRLGLTWDPQGDGQTLLRAGFGIYYDQALVGIFEQNAFTNPPLTANVNVLNARLSNPGAGTTATTRGVVNLIATSDPFVTPRITQWNVGAQRQLYRRGVIDVSYVGSRGDNLVQPVDVNQAQPADVVALAGAVNAARPFPGYGVINIRQTTARSRYHGLLVNFRHDGGRAGLLNVSYTLSQTKATASNDRDAIDLPQNPLDLEAEYAPARTDRTHVFTANYVYELPFFREAKGLSKALLGGWQLSGITQFWSGLPISRVVNGTTNGSRRGIRVDQVSDPSASLPANVPGGVYWFNPAAFAPPADGSYGNTGRAIFRLPGVNQWDLTLSKNWYPSGKTRVQFRADFINAFNHTQLDPVAIQNVCTVAATATSCAASTGSFGQITATRAPREIQLGLKLFWN